MLNKIGFYFTCVAMGMGLALSGCAGKEQAVIRTELIEAEAMFKAAAILGADTRAPAEMARARSELDRAGLLLNSDPRSGRLSYNIKQKSDSNRESAESVKRALAETEQALVVVGSGRSGAEAREITVSDLPAETLVGLRQEIEADVLGTTKQVVEECQQDLDTARQDSLSRERLNAARLENIRQSLRPGPVVLYSALVDEFADDLIGWGAEIDRESLSVRFVGSATAFKNGSTWVNRPLRRILEDFFPRLMKVISRPEYKGLVKELVVTGYASTVHKLAGDESERHHLNMLLSQERAANAVRFLLRQPTLQSEWLRSHLVAAGMADNQPVLAVGGLENERQSRRIEIRIITLDNSVSHKLGVGSSSVDVG